MTPVLNILGTKPEYRRRGVASDMIKWGVDRADEEGLEAFVISAPMARPVYLKHGFELVLEGEDLGGEHGTFVPGYMLRKPRKVVPEKAAWGGVCHMVGGPGGAGGRGCVGAEIGEEVSVGMGSDVG